MTEMLSLLQDLKKWILKIGSGTFYMSYVNVRLITNMGINSFLVFLKIHVNFVWYHLGVSADTAFRKVLMQML